MCRGCEIKARLAEITSRKAPIKAELQMFKSQIRVCGYSQTRSAELEAAIKGSLEVSRIALELEYEACALEAEFAQFFLQSLMDDGDTPHPNKFN